MNSGVFVICRQMISETKTTVGADLNEPNPLSYKKEKHVGSMIWWTVNYFGSKLTRSVRAEFDWPGLSVVLLPFLFSPLFDGSHRGSVSDTVGLGTEPWCKHWS